MSCLYVWSSDYLFGFYGDESKENKDIVTS